MRDQLPPNDIVLLGLRVQENANGDRHCAQTTEESHGVAKHYHRQPDQKGSLHRVRNTEINKRFLFIYLFNDALKTVGIYLFI